MKPIGLIGGMSWESTLVYYQEINRQVAQRLGGLHSAQIRLHSCDFAEIVALQQQGAWDVLARKLTQAARAVERAGAGCVAICTNTMHKVADEVQAEVGIPLIDIRDVTGTAIVAQNLTKVGLLGTRYTMEQDFWSARFRRKFGLEVVTPQIEADRADVHRIIFDELCQGIQREESRQRLIEISSSLARCGAQGTILGCTELMLLMQPQDSPLPVFDTTKLHAQALVDFALMPDAPATPSESFWGEDAERLPFADFAAAI